MEQTNIDGCSEVRIQIEEPANTERLINIDSEMQRMKLIEKKTSCLTGLMFRLRDKSEVQHHILRLCNEIMEVKPIHLTSAQQLSIDEKMKLMELAELKTKCMLILTHRLDGEARDVILKLCHELMEI